MDKKMLEDILRANCGDAVLLEADDKFNAGCNKCGKCCIGRNDVTIKVNDIRRLSLFLGMDSYEVILNHISMYNGYGSNVPQLVLENDEVTDYCTFLEKTYEGFICTVEDAKPDVCRSYPLGRAIAPNEEGESEIFYFSPMGASNYMNCLPKEEQREFTLKEWTKNSNIDEDLKWNAAFLSKINAIDSLSRDIFKLSAENVKLFSTLVQFLFQTNLKVDDETALKEYRDLSTRHNQELLKTITIRAFGKEEI